jgi:hypothetical protein
VDRWVRTRRQQPGRAGRGAILEDGEARGFAWAVPLVFEYPIFLREGLTTPALVLDLVASDLSQRQREALALCVARTRAPDGEEFDELVARFASFEWQAESPEWAGLANGLRAGRHATALLELLAERGLPSSA